jgi:hypothetical protein
MWVTVAGLSCGSRVLAGEILGECSFGTFNIVRSAARASLMAPVLDDPDCPVAPCLVAFYRFIVYYEKIIGLFLFTVTTASRVDRMQAVAAHALADVEERAKPIEQFNKKLMEKRIRELFKAITPRPHCLYGEQFPLLSFRSSSGRDE